jgi:membrane protease subunit (stomatin/prohibitin family)
MIKQAQRDAMYRDQTYAAATLVGAQAQAMKDAAKNANGAAMGFMGMNMAQGAGGISANQLYANGAAQQQPAPAVPAAPAANGWTCPKCGTVNSGNFCGNCGEKKPDSGKWICPKCGKENEGNFCGNCGEKKPA